jgi:hypothetical protein
VSRTGRLLLKASTIKWPRATDVKRELRKRDMVSCQFSVAVEIVHLDVIVYSLWQKVAERQTLRDAAADLA